MKPGLEGVLVAETMLSDVLGDAGRLVIAGYDVEALGKSQTFEAATQLLFDAAGLSFNPKRLGEARAAIDPTALVFLPDAMASLRASVAKLTDDDPHHVLGAVAVYAAAWARRTAGQPPLTADPRAAHAADVYRLFGGGEDKTRARAFERYLLAVIDHGMNASTFTARVIASTGSDTVSAITGAIGALKGPLHGGAPGPVLDMLDGVGTPDNAVAWLEAELAAGRRIMGMGHRVYRTRDPRAAVLEAAIAELPNAGRLTLARAVEHAARNVLKKRHPDRPLDTNVEFYTAVLLDALSLDRRSFSTIFALSRTAGWLAHVAEQRAKGRLIRPDSHYVGRR